MAVPGRRLGVCDSRSAVTVASCNGECDAACLVTVGDLRAVFRLLPPPGRGRFVPCARYVLRLLGVTVNWLSWLRPGVLFVTAAAGPGIGRLVLSSGCLSWLRVGP
jgi:hypothetical protein